MKSTRSRFVMQIAMVMALAFFAGSCSDKPESIAPGKGNLALSFTSNTASNGRSSDGAPPATIFVSVEDDNGNKKEYIRLKVLAFGEGYVSENLELAVGTYRLTMFHVLDEERNILYSTPKEGSAMARFVNDPLDIEFKIDEDAVTSIDPEVLAVKDLDPGQFGYANFSFQKIDVTALILPETDEEIVKVTYEFKNVFQTYKGEEVPDANGVIALKNDKLYNNRWHAQINVYTDKKDCSTPWSVNPYQKVYRLTTELTFLGAAIELPSYDDARWEPLYYRGNSEIGFFFSANPTKSYSLEIEVFNNDIHADNAWMDRYYYAEGGPDCGYGEDRYTTVVMNGERLGKLIMKDLPECEKGLRSVDSFVAVNTNKGPFIEHFVWNVVNGEFVPGCAASISAHDLKTPAERKGPGL